MTTIQKLAAALRELLAEDPDETQARAFLSEIPVDEKNAVADALISAAATLCGQHALARVKAGADR